MDKVKAVRKMAQDTISALKPGTEVQLSRLHSVGMDRRTGKYYVMVSGNMYYGLGHDAAADRLVKEITEASK
jgi:hypothetical protein